MDLMLPSLSIKAVEFAEFSQPLGDRLRLCTGCGGRVRVVLDASDIVGTQLSLTE